MMSGTPPPTSIGRYRIEALLGRGGMGEVYKAYDPRLDRTVALKTILQGIDDPSFVERLKREARVCARLQHPGIVTLHDIDEADGLVFVAMEFLEGQTLASLITAGSLSFEDKCRILIQMLDALQYAHDRGLVHRDIKPGNVQVLSGLVTKLLDFGLARNLRADTMTLTGAIMGTPSYMSPEQLKGERVDARTDIYAAGIVAYELFTGRKPFEADTVTAVMLKIIGEDPAPIDRRFAAAYPELEAWILRAMAKKPDDRFGSTQEMVQAFRTCLTAQQLRESSRTLAPVPDQRREVTGRESSRTLPPVPDQRKQVVAARTVVPAANVPEARPEVRPAERSVTSGAARIPPAPTPIAVSSSKPWMWVVGSAVAVVAVFLGVRTMLPGDSSGQQNGQVARQTPPQPTRSLGADREVASPVSPVATGAGTSVGAAAPPGPVPQVESRGAEQPPAPSATTAPPPSPPQAQTPVGAKNLFYAPAGSSDAAAPIGRGSGSSKFQNAGLRYQIVQRSPLGGELQVDPDSTFRSGDRVRFSFQSNTDGYLYVLLEGSSGRSTVLFPHPDINGGRNSIRGFQEYSVPPDDWFEFDANPGSERILVYLSKTPVHQLPGSDRPVTRIETLAQSVVEGLKDQVKSRDLVLQKDRPADPATTKANSGQATYVVNLDELSQAVTATIQLTHR